MEVQQQAVQQPVVQQSGDDKKDGGQLRLIISLCFLAVSALCFWFGYELLKLGISGTWKVLSTLKGWDLYLASILPGLLFIVVGASVLSLGLPKTLRSLRF